MRSFSNTDDDPTIFRAISAQIACLITNEQIVRVRQTTAGQRLFVMWENFFESFIVLDKRSTAEMMRTKPFLGAC